MRDVAIIGVGMIKFGRYPEKTVPELAAQAAHLALKDAGVDMKDVELVASGNLYQSNAMVGQRIMQSASDLFLGWTEGQLGRQFYIRQLKDMKIKPLVETFLPTTMRNYGKLCGRILARAHARSGESAKISGYLGKKGVFDEAIADFSVAYADQAERDHETLLNAVRAGRLDVFIEGA